MALHASAVRTGAFRELQVIYVYMIGVQHLSSPEPSTCTSKVRSNHQRRGYCDTMLQSIARIDTVELSAPSSVRSLRECTIRSAAEEVLSDQSLPIRLWFSVASYLGHSSFHASVTHGGEVSGWYDTHTEKATNAPGTGLT